MNKITITVHLDYMLINTTESKRKTYKDSFIYMYIDLKKKRKIIGSGSDKWTFRA